MKKHTYTCLCLQIVFRVLCSDIIKIINKLSWLGLPVSITIPMPCRCDAVWPLSPGGHQERHCGPQLRHWLRVRRGELGRRALG